MTSVCSRGSPCRGLLDLEALVTRRTGIDDVEDAFADMAAGRGARSMVCFDTTS